METIGLAPLNVSVLSRFSHFNFNQSNIQFPKNHELYQQWAPIQAAVVGFANSQSTPRLAALIFAVLWAFYQFARTAYSWSNPKVSTAVHHGYRSWFEPTILVQARFLVYAKDIISSGFRKYGDKPFIVRRWDNDITIFHNKYIGEICAFPNSKASAMQAQIKNLGHKWNWMTILGESNLFRQVLQQKLIGDLPSHLEAAHDELDLVWSQELPECEDWTEVDIQHLMHYLVAHTSSRVFVGRPACNNPEFIKLVVDYTMDIFLAAFSFRLFPAWLHPLVAPFNIFRWRVWWHIGKAQEILKPVIERHREVVRRRKNGEQVEEDDTLLHWMMDHGNEKENTLLELSIRQCLMTLASIHTTSNGLSHLFFDLCAHQEYIPELRAEIFEIEKEFGKLGERPEIPVKQWLPRLEKLDSFYVESQRFNPAILSEFFPRNGYDGCFLTCKVIPQRQILAPLTLKDGTHIPEGTRIAFCNADILDSTLPNPDTFDPMRSYRRRYETGDLLKYRAGMTDKDNLHFGYGKSACPGRHFAVAEIKMTAMKLIRDYEFKYPDGKGRPKNYYADEYVFADPRAKILLRKRKDV